MSNLHDIAQMMISPEPIVDDLSDGGFADHDFPGARGPTASSRPSSITDEYQRYRDTALVHFHRHNFTMKTPASEWALSHADFSEYEDPKIDALPVKSYVFRNQQGSILERLITEVNNHVDFEEDLFKELNLQFFCWGVENGIPSHRDIPPAIDLSNLKLAYADLSVRNMVEHQKRIIRLPIGPTVVKDIKERQQFNKLGPACRNPQGETQLESLVVLSNASTASDPLKIFSVHTMGDELFVKELSKFRENYVDTSEALQTKLNEKLSVHFSKPGYSIVVGTNSKEVIFDGNYKRSFLISIPTTFADLARELMGLEGVRTVCDLTDYEKSQLAKIFHDVSKLCRIEFDSFGSYDYALHTYAVQYGWKKFPTMSRSEQPVTSRQLCLQFKWFTWPSKRQALISLAQEDIDRCIGVLEKHDFLVYDVTPNRSGNTDKGELVIKAKEADKYYKMWHYENELKPILHTILHGNNISYRKIILMRKKQQDIQRKLKTIILEVNSRIIKSAYNCGGDVWSRKVPSSEELDRLAADQSQLPWETIMKKSKEPEATIEVRFDDEVFGRAIADYMMPRSPDPGFFTLFSRDSIGVRIFPFYNVVLPVPANIVKACLPDLVTSTIYYGDAEPEANSVIVNKHGTRNSFGRIVAKPSEDHVTVELWPERIIPCAITVLNTVLEGRKFDCSHEPFSALLFGRGLEWLNNLATRSEPHVVMRVDRLQSRLVLYGSRNNVETFIDFVQVFCTKTIQYVIREKISLKPPRFLPCIPRVLGQIVGRKKLWLNFGEVEFNELDLSIDFCGSLKKLNELNIFLEDLNEMVMSNAEPILGLMSRPIESFPEYQANRPTCPVCSCRVQISGFCLDSCGHYYCLECICEQIERQTRYREFPWRCLYPDCEKEISMSDVKDLLCFGGNVPFWFSKDDMQKFFDPLRDYLIRDPMSSYVGCDTPNCNGLFQKLPGFGIVREEDEKDDQPTSSCFDCGVTRCLNCLQFAHDGLSCWHSARIKDDVDASIAHFKERNANARNCPTTACGAVIIKDNGCNHVFCPYCRTHFCWTCFQAFDSSQAVYGHMHSVHGSFGGGWVIEDGVVVNLPDEE